MLTESRDFSKGFCYEKSFHLFVDVGVKVILTLRLRFSYRLWVENCRSCEVQAITDARWGLMRNSSVHITVVQTHSAPGGSTEHVQPDRKQVCAVSAPAELQFIQPSLRIWVGDAASSLGSEQAHLSDLCLCVA